MRYPIKESTGQPYGFPVGVKVNKDGTVAKDSPVKVDSEGKVAKESLKAEEEKKK